MATLEIHDGRNQVRRVRITRENPAMFGSDPMCDIVLAGQGVQPFHGRIRWKAGRFKADASPEVSSIEVNGVLVKSKSIYQGDEIRVGNCRIFLLSLEDGPDHGEKTVVQDRPPASSSKPARPGPPAAVDYHRMEMAPPSMEMPGPRSAGPATPEAPLKRTRHRRPADFDDVEEAISGKPKKTTLTNLMHRHGRKSAEIPARVDSGLEEGQQDEDEDHTASRTQGLGRLFSRLDRAPGDDRVLTSPMVIGLVVTFGLLVAFSILLWGMIARVNAARQYDVAIADMEATEFPNAIKGFSEFLASNPEDRRAGKAKVLRALARVRQHTGSVGASWGNALTEALAMVEEVGSLEEYRDSSLDLAEELRKSAEALADRASELADPKTLAQAESAVRLHARVVGAAAGSLLDRSKIPQKLNLARAAIRKGRDRSDAIGSMDAALKANRPGDAYSSRDALIRLYPDLGPDKEVVSRLKQANDLVRLAVSLDTSSRPGETTPAIEPLGPPTSLVQRLEPARGPANGKGPIAFALADGIVYGLDAATGAPLWQVPVGLSSPFPPVAIAGDPPTALVVDARSVELIRLNARTGALIWRQGLGGLVADPPLVLGNQVFQPTIDGRMLQIDLATGSLRATLQLGRALAKTPVADDSAQHLYQFADEDCLFILGLDPLSCVAVEYLGHEAGSVAASPARAGRFFVMTENQSIDQGRWRVFVMDEAGTALKPVQELPVGGWSSATPAIAGPVIWSSSDRGELIAYSIGLYDSKDPFTSIARIAPGTELEGPAFPRAKTERDFWLASSRSGRFELDLERGRLGTSWSVRQAGPALAASQSFDRMLVLTQQHDEGAGTSLWGLDPTSGEVRWRTLLGASWPSRLANSTSGDSLSTVGGDGRAVTIGLEALRAGGFVELPLPRLGVFRLPPTMTDRIEVDGATVVVPEPGATRLLVRIGSGEFRPVELPTMLATTVLAVGKNLLIPGSDGRVYLIDPRTGLSAADPFVPAFDRTRPIRWRAPVLVDGDAFVLADSEATLRRLAVDRSSRPRLVVTAELTLEKPLASDPASTGPSILVVTTDGKVRSLASRDLGPQGSWTLEAPRLVGPVAVAEHGFVADDAGNLLAFSPDGRRIWSAKLADTIAAGPPAVLDRSAWLLGRDGSVQRFSMADGSPQSRTTLEILPVGGPIAVGPELVLPTGLGSLRVLDPSRRQADGGPNP